MKAAKRARRAREMKHKARDAGLLKKSRKAQHEYTIDNQQKEIDALKSLEVDNNNLAGVSPVAKEAQLLQDKLEQIEAEHPGAVVYEELKQAREAGQAAAKEVASKAKKKDGMLGYAYSWSA